MTHKQPGSDVWDLTLRSHELWHKLAESLNDEGLDPEELLGWKKTGFFSDYSLVTSLLFRVWSSLINFVYLMNLA